MCLAYTTTTIKHIHNTLVNYSPSLKRHIHMVNIVAIVVRTCVCDVIVPSRVITISSSAAAIVRSHVVSIIMAPAIIAVSAAAAVVIVPLTVLIITQLAESLRGAISYLSSSSATTTPIVSVVGRHIHATVLYY